MESRKKRGQERIRKAIWGEAVFSEYWSDKFDYWTARIHHDDGCRTWLSPPREKSREKTMWSSKYSSSIFISISRHPTHDLQSFSTSRERKVPQAIFLTICENRNSFRYFIDFRARRCSRAGEIVKGTKMITFFGRRGCTAKVSLQNTVSLIVRCFLSSFSWWLQT